MTPAEAAALIGQHGELLTEGYELRVDVEVLDVKQPWNRTDLLVTPVAGSGQKWVSSDRVLNIRPVVVAWP